MIIQMTMNNMTPDLHKELEESAKQYALNKLGNQFQDEYPHRRRTFAVHSNFELDDAFVDGAELGYKEAIKAAKEWLKSSFFQCLGEDDNIHWDSSYDDITEALEFFETDMNKLWEGEK